MQASEGVRKEGVEPSRVSPPDPKSGASASSATFASGGRHNITTRYSCRDALANRPVRSGPGRRLPAGPTVCDRVGVLGWTVSALSDCCDERFEPRDLCAL